MLFAAYYVLDCAPKMITGERNKQIVAWYEAGETLSELACTYELFPQHMYQIVRHKQ